LHRPHGRDKNLRTEEERRRSCPWLGNKSICDQKHASLCKLSRVAPLGGARVVSRKGSLHRCRLGDARRGHSCTFHGRTHINKNGLSRLRRVWMMCGCTLHTHRKALHTHPNSPTTLTSPQLSPPPPVVTGEYVHKRLCPRTVRCLVRGYPRTGLKKQRGLRHSQRPPGRG